MDFATAVQPVTVFRWYLVAPEAIVDARSVDALPVLADQPVRSLSAQHTCSSVALKQR
jgi:hypothetical protein